LRLVWCYAVLKHRPDRSAGHGHEAQLAPERHDAFYRVTSDRPLRNASANATAIDDCNVLPGFVVVPDSAVANPSDAALGTWAGGLWALPAHQE
jgi:hypothetical protein